MAYRTRIYYTDAQKAEMWERWQRGETHGEHYFSHLNILQYRRAGIQMHLGGSQY